MAHVCHPVHESKGQWDIPGFFLIHGEVTFMTCAFRINISPQQSDSAGNKPQRQTITQLQNSWVLFYHPGTLTDANLLGLQSLQIKQATFQVLMQPLHQFLLILGE